MQYLNKYDNIKKNIQNIDIIPGASLFAKKYNEKYSQIPLIPQNIEEEKENQKFFFKLELDRLIEANKLKSIGKDVFMDRGVLEILSVAYSFEYIKNWRGIYENAKELYKKFILITKQIGIELPDKYIWLQAGNEEIVRRNQTRQMERGQRLSENDWIESNLINKQIEFFDQLCIPGNKDKIYLIDTNNMTKQEVLLDVCQLLNLKEKEIEEKEEK